MHNHNAAKNIGLRYLRRNQTGGDKGAPVGVRLNSRTLNANGEYEPPAEESARVGVHTESPPFRGGLAYTAFGGMLQDLVELTSIVLRPELLDAEIERRCKHAWEDAPCPECGETTIQSGDDNPRVWCTSCRYMFK